MRDAARSGSLLTDRIIMLPDTAKGAAHWHRVKEPSPIFSTFFKLFEILISQESSCFSLNSWLILQLISIAF